MTIRGAATHRLLTRFGRARLDQSLALPAAPGSLVFLGDAFALEGCWPEWFPDAPVRVLGDEGILIRETAQLLPAVGKPSALVLMVGNADLFGLGGSRDTNAVASRLGALLDAALGQVAPAPVYVVGIAGRRRLGDRAERFNAAAARVVADRGATFVPVTASGGGEDDGFLVSLARWSPAAHAEVAQALAPLLGLTATAAHPFGDVGYPDKKFLAETQRKRAQLFDTLPVPAGGTVLLGDSITDGGAWDGWLPGPVVFNRGIGGDTIAEMLARIDTAIGGSTAGGQTTAGTQSATGGPTAVSVLGGTNDLVRGETTDPDGIVGRFRDLVSAIRDRAPKVPLVINSVMPRQEKFADRIEAINLHYRSIADEFGAHYLDLWPALARARSFTAQGIDGRQPAPECGGLPGVGRAAGRGAAVATPPASTGFAA